MARRVYLLRFLRLISSVEVAVRGALLLIRMVAFNLTSTVQSSGLTDISCSILSCHSGRSARRAPQILSVLCGEIALEQPPNQTRLPAPGRGAKLLSDGQPQAPVMKLYYQDAPAVRSYPSSTVWPCFRMTTPRIYREFEGFLSSGPFSVVAPILRYLKKMLA